MNNEAQRPIVIPDGYTRTVGFEAADGYPEFTFTYRPLVEFERREAGKIVLLEENEEIRNAGWRDMLARAVQGWSVSDAFARDLRKCDSTIVQMISDVVMGLRAPDFELANDGERATPNTDEDDQKN